MEVSPSKGFSHLYNDLNTQGLTQLSNPVVLVMMVGILIFYLFIFNSLGVSYNAQEVTQQGTGNLGGIEIIMWGMFVFLILINGVQYFFGIDVKTNINKLFTAEPVIDILVNNKIFGAKRKEAKDLKEFLPEGVTPETATEEDIKEAKKTKKAQAEYDKAYKDGGKDELDGGFVKPPEPKKEVFHVRNNLYSYEDAKAVCKAYGSRLADYSEIEDAYMKGAEWCGYGWSKHQMGFFPTQKESWEKAQKEEGECGGKNNDCGRPGVNGGFFKNPNLKLGVNCYGIKREPTSLEKSKWFGKGVCKSKGECQMDSKVNKYRGKLRQIGLSPFNKEIWSKENPDTQPLKKQDGDEENEHTHSPSKYHIKYKTHKEPPHRKHQHSMTKAHGHDKAMKHRGIRTHAEPPLQRHSHP